LIDEGPLRFSSKSQLGTGTFEQDVANSDRFAISRSIMPDAQVTGGGTPSTLAAKRGSQPHTKQA
jgi:hypothetical protein